MSETAADILDRTGALHTRREDADVNSRKTLDKNFYEVANDRALWGSNDSDAERKAIRITAEGIPGVVEVNDHLMETPIVAY